MLWSQNSKLSGFAAPMCSTPVNWLHWDLAFSFPWLFSTKQSTRWLTNISFMPPFWQPKWTDLNRLNLNEDIVEHEQGVSRELLWYLIWSNIKDTKNPRLSRLLTVNLRALQAFSDHCFIFLSFSVSTSHSACDFARIHCATLFRSCSRTQVPAWLMKNNHQYAALEMLSRPNLNQTPASRVKILLCEVWGCHTSWTGQKHSQWM